MYQKTIQCNCWNYLEDDIFTLTLINIISCPSAVSVGLRSWWHCQSFLFYLIWREMNLIDFLSYWEYYIFVSHALIFRRNGTAWNYKLKIKLRQTVGYFWSKMTSNSKPGKNLNWQNQKWSSLLSEFRTFLTALKMCSIFWR